MRLEIACNGDKREDSESKSKFDFGRSSAAMAPSSCGSVMLAAAYIKQEIVCG